MLLKVILIMVAGGAIASLAFRYAFKKSQAELELD